MQHVDIGIVGGGIVGLTLAAALKESSLSVAIIDKHPLSTALGEKPFGIKTALAIFILAVKKWAAMPLALLLKTRH